ncbi:MAG: CoA-binding protein [Candidatus Scalindua sp.]|jgi:acyl-CoA synthetase (NDP forming)|nr:CoA-binding protein [Candidatus Scalindua sp.]MDV5165786.1 CoA-binding protein [Candidatus Scalindua sp.]
MYIDKFFNPQSVAIIGATEDPQNITSIIIQNLFEMGFKGSVVPVNPHHDKVFGLKCYPSLLDINEKIDLSVIAISSSHVLEILEQHIGSGIKNSIIISSGFAEIGNKGVVIEEKVKKISRENGIRVIGPNCLGVLDNYSNFSTFFLPWSKVDLLPKN